MKANSFRICTVLCVTRKNNARWFFKGFRDNTWEISWKPLKRWSFVCIYTYRPHIAICNYMPDTFLRKSGILKKNLVNITWIFLDYFHRFWFLNRRKMKREEFFPQITNLKINPIIESDIKFPPCLFLFPYVGVVSS